MSFTIHENGRIEYDNDETIMENDNDYYEPPKPDIYDEIQNERQRQDKKWGGAKHDDEHAYRDFVEFIKRHANKATYNPNDLDYVDLPTFRKQMIRVAALAVAAIESHDRRER
jgi:hypothetical protein